jgi:hypothetical protein
MKGLIRIAIVLAFALWPVLSSGQDHNIQFRPRGSGFADVAAGQHNNDTSGNNCLTSEGEDETSPWVAGTSDAGAPVCDETASPLMEGAQYLHLKGIGDSASTSVIYDNLFPDVTGGAIILEFDMNVTAEASGASHFIMRYRQGGGFARPFVLLQETPNKLQFYCGTGGASSAIASPGYVVGTPQRVKLEFYITGGPGDCIGLDPNCSDCGCLWIDGVHKGSCDSPSNNGYPDGIYYNVPADEYDIGWDAWHFCLETPPPGTRCGDGLGLSF